MTTQSVHEYVLGHQNPDTDSLCSAIVYARFLGATPILLGSINNEARFALEHTGTQLPEIHTTLPEGSRIHLVDHNESVQSIYMRDHHTILSVIDHHKIGNFETALPLMMRIDPVGCTCTILFEYFNQQKYTIPAVDATLMISAIISDTLFLKSPTTTQRDHDAMHGLYAISSLQNHGIPLDEYATQQFAAKSSLTGMSAYDIVTSDLKSFEVEGHHISIGVFETTNGLTPFTMKDSLMETMQSIKSETGVGIFLFCIVDIIKEHTSAFILGDAEEHLVLSAFGSNTNDGVADLGGRVSRKKQLVPEITNYFLR